MGKIVAVCTSAAKGTQKKDINTCLLKVKWGLENDAHGGDWHRQVSLLSYDKVKAFNQSGAGVDHGDFGENILVEGIDLAKLPIGTMLQCGQALIEVTQIGKECHSKCQIYHKMGDCIMPREGIFAKVITEGQVTVGDSIDIVLSAAVLTLSDKGSTGQREDVSGKIIADTLTKAGYVLKDQQISPDDKDQIIATLKDMIEGQKPNLILTTGGTGLSPRDITPEATLEIADRIVPGIAEAMRAKSIAITPRGMLSRGVAVTAGNTLVVNLPGSPKAVDELLEYILPTLTHGVEILAGFTGECGRTV